MKLKLPSSSKKRKKNTLAANPDKYLHTALYLSHDGEMNKSREKSLLLNVIHNPDDTSSLCSHFTTGQT